MITTQQALNLELDRLACRLERLGFAMATTEDPTIHSRLESAADVTAERMEEIEAELADLHAAVSR